MKRSKSMLKTGLKALLGATLLLPVVVAFALAEPAADRKPNIVLIMLDDAGPEVFEVFGRSEFQTPNITQLASEGVLFTRAQSTPICTPSRVKIMTGRHSFQNYGEFGHLNYREKTFGNLLSAAGYATGVVGKWQLSGSKALRNGSPEHFGFDDYLLFLYQPDDMKAQLKKDGVEIERYHAPVFYSNGNIVKGEQGQFGPDMLNDYALQFIDKNKGQPFFLYYPMMLPHWPFVTTPLSKNPNETDWHKNFTDMVIYADLLVGKVVDRIEALGLDDNTLILFTSDNGSYPALRYTFQEKVVFGGKSYPQQSGYHVPMIARFAEGGKGLRVSNLIDFTDVLPTLAEAAGVAVPESYNVAGRSFLPLVRGEKIAGKDYILAYYPSTDHRPERRSLSIENERFKLYSDGRMHDVVADPEELHPLFPFNDTAQSAEVRRELDGHMKANYDKYPELVDTRASLINDRRRRELGLVIGSWKITQSEHIQRWDVTPFITGDGNYSFRIQQYKGTGDVAIDSVKLLAGDRIADRDDHRGWSRQAGEGYRFKQQHEAVLFRLKVTDYSPGQSYSVQARLKQAHKGMSIGHLRLVAPVKNFGAAGDSGTD